MLLDCMALPLQNEPKHSYVGPAVTEIIYFLSVHSSFEISLREASWDDGGGAQITAPPLWNLMCYWRVLSRHTRFLCISHGR